MAPRDESADPAVGTLTEDPCEESRDRVQATPGVEGASREYAAHLSRELDLLVDADDALDAGQRALFPQAMRSGVVAEGLVALGTLRQKVKAAKRSVELEASL